MEIRDAVDADWAAVWGFLQQIVAAGDTYCWPPDTSEEAARTWWMGKPDRRVLSPSTTVRSTEPLSFIRVSRLLAACRQRWLHRAPTSRQDLGVPFAHHVLEVASGRWVCQRYRCNTVVATTAAVRLWESLGFTILAHRPRGFQHPDRRFVGLPIMHRFL